MVGDREIFFKTTLLILLKSTYTLGNKKQKQKYGFPGLDSTLFTLFSLYTICGKKEAIIHNYLYFLPFPLQRMVSHLIYLSKIQNGMKTSVLKNETKNRLRQITLKYPSFPIFSC